jgi:hypothetical protein
MMDGSIQGQLMCAQAKTRTIDNNGFNPIWDETMEFEVNVPGQRDEDDEDDVESSHVLQSLPFLASVSSTRTCLPKMI